MEVKLFGLVLCLFGSVAFADTFSELREIENARRVKTMEIELESRARALEVLLKSTKDESPESLLKRFIELRNQQEDLEDTEVSALLQSYDQQNFSQISAEVRMNSADLEKVEMEVTFAFLRESGNNEYVTFNTIASAKGLKLTGETYSRSTVMNF